MGVWNAKQLISAAALLAVVTSGCAKIKGEEKFDGLACGAADQQRSYMNPMDSTRIQTISIDSKFNAGEIADIESAVHAWNSESRLSIGRDIFQTQVLAISANSVPQGAQDCSFPGANGAFSVVKVTDQAQWSALGFSKNNPGVTIRCAAGKEYAEKQVILINSANMTGSLSSVFESVVLHELGHSIGLDHSCDPSNSGIPGFAGCGAKGTDPSYKEAVMYPFVSSSDLREDLRRNDQERATCALNYRP